MTSAEKALFSLDLSNTFPINGLLSDAYFRNESISLDTVPWVNGGGFWT